MSLYPRCMQELDEATHAYTCSLVHTQLQAREEHPDICATSIEVYLVRDINITTTSKPHNASKLHPQQCPPLQTQKCSPPSPWSVPAAPRLRKTAPHILPN